MELINEVEWGHRGIEMQYPRFKIEYIKIAILKNEFKYFIKTDWHLLTLMSKISVTLLIIILFFWINKWQLVKSFKLF